MENQDKPTTEPVTAATPGPRNWNCKFCPLTFDRLSAAEEHVRVKHPQPTVTAATPGQAYPLQAAVSALQRLADKTPMGNWDEPEPPEVALRRDYAQAALDEIAATPGQAAYTPGQAAFGAYSRAESETGLISIPWSDMADSVHAWWEAAAQAAIDASAYVSSLEREALERDTAATRVPRTCGRAAYEAHRASFWKRHGWDGTRLLPDGQWEAIGEDAQADWEAAAAPGDTLRGLVDEITRTVREWPVIPGGTAQVADWRERAGLPS